MRLKRHLPDFINEIREFKELDKTHNYELNKLNSLILDVQNNQFINTATSAGLSRYEKMLGIPTNSDDDVRRFNIISKYNSSIPFTMNWLINLLNASVGKGFYLIELHPNIYKLTISVVKDKEYIIESLSNDLRKKLPANLIVDFKVLTNMDISNYVGFIIRTADKQMI